jgi:hypothetical protein
VVVDARNVFSHCSVSFSKFGCGTVWTELLLKHILWYTLLIHENVVVDARNVFSHCSVPFSKFGCGTVWTELLLKHIL